MKFYRLGPGRDHFLQDSCESVATVGDRKTACGGCGKRKRGGWSGVRAVVDPNLKRSWTDWLGHGLAGFWSKRVVEAFTLAGFCEMDCLAFDFRTVEGVEYWESGEYFWCRPGIGANVDYDYWSRTGRKVVLCKDCGAIVSSTGLDVGYFFPDAKSWNGASIFTVFGSDIIWCSEEVRLAVEEKGFTNFQFLERGVLEEEDQNMWA